MQYIIRAYSKEPFSNLPEWSYITGYSNGAFHGLVMCGYVKYVCEAQKFNQRSDARKASNRLLTREVKGFMRRIYKVTVIRIP